jgi:starch synthase
MGTNTTPPRTRVLFVTPECAPLAKAGGLGDVSAALPAALRELGVDVRVLLPGYPGVLAAAEGARELARISAFEPALGARLLEAALPGGVPLIVLDSPGLFARSGGPYQGDSGEDWPDNALRFGMLSKAAALVGGGACGLDWRPDVVHCNDWPAGLAAAYLHFSAPPRAASVMTVHNAAFQGNFDPAWLARLSLPPASFALDGLEFHGSVSFLKAGLFYADALTTVSPTYAREIRTQAQGFGMDGLLRLRGESLSGILNGIDAGTWNPASDPLIAAPYAADTLELKSANKAALQRRLGLAVDGAVPLLGVVSRLTHQKGIDLVLEAAPRLLALPAQLAVLGAGARALEEACRALARRHPGSVAVAVGFDEGLAHLIEAGADLFLMPSRFEPCGMNQMYSQRYGTPPVARATGGLVDTVVDCDAAALADGSATGFVFGEATSSALLGAVERAVALYRDPRGWRLLQRNGMKRDFGWSGAARQYARIYARVAARPKR